jgi:hypothetical protein
MTPSLLLTIALQATACGPITNAQAPEAGDTFLYESVIYGETSDILMRNDIVAGRGLATVFYQGGGLSRDDISVNRQSPVRGYGGIAFVRSLGTGSRRREFSYSPSPDEVLARLEPGESADIYVHERSGGAGERYRLSVSFDRCDAYAVGDETLPANVYTISRAGEENEDDAGSRVIWLSRTTGWWLMDSHPERESFSRLIAINE